jgi:hypothetical protein
MMGTTPPPGTSCRPCQLDPERWFDRHNHADALSGCLACPARRWCAREALQCRASWGLWAGVWIDGRHDDAVPYLQAIVAGTVAECFAVAADVIADSPGCDRSAPIATRLCRPFGSSPSRSAKTAVLARSSGHCEVMSEGCRYTYDLLVGRRSGVASPETSTPPDLFAACDICAEMVAALDPKLAARFGYVTDAHRDPAHVPFYWRRSRWVLLDRDGWLTEMSNGAQTA